MVESTSTLKINNKDQTEAYLKEQGIEFHVSNLFIDRIYVRERQQLCSSPCATHSNCFSTVRRL